MTSSFGTARAADRAIAPDSAMAATADDVEAVAAANRTTLIASPDASTAASAVLGAGVTSPLAATVRDRIARERGARHRSV
jgi:hypothetical protein